MTPTKQDRISSLQFFIDTYRDRAIKALNHEDLVTGYKCHDNYMVEVAYFENLLKKENSNAR